MSPEEVRRHYRKAVLPIVTTERDGQISCIGTGFLIATAGRSALMLTAKHNIDEIARIDKPYPRAHPSAIFKVESVVTRFDYTKPHAIFCKSDVAAHPALLEGSVGLSEIDISACQILFGDDVPREVNFDLRLGIDTRLRAVGERIMAVGYSTMESKMTATYRDRNDHSFSGRFRMLEGNVIEVSPEGTRKAPCFAVDVPLEPGMSGGPVFTEDEAGNFFVRGMVRSGFDVDGPQHSGRELVTAIWPAAMISLVLPTPGRALARRTTIRDLIAAGKIFDFGNIDQRLRVAVSDDGCQVDTEWLSDVS